MCKLFFIMAQLFPVLERLWLAALRCDVTFLSLLIGVLR
jgi:hypothetical protein